MGAVLKLDAVGSAVCRVFICNGKEALLAERHSTDIRFQHGAHIRKGSGNPVLLL